MGTRVYSQHVYLTDGVPLRATSYGRGIFLGTQWSEDAESEEARLVPCWVNPKSAESTFFAG